MQLFLKKLKLKLILFFLKVHQTDKIAHRKSSFLEHLLGTYNLLVSWELEESICLAGLFHSIYGTKFFTHATVRQEFRFLIKILIGGKAEKLAYLFSVSERPSGFLKGLETGFLENRITHKLEQFPPEIIHNLVAIECANLIDQGGGVEFLKQIIQKFSALNSGFLNDKIFNTINAFLNQKLTN
jgi:hypothetical protein